MKTIKHVSMTSALLVALALPLGAQQGTGPGATREGAGAGQTPPGGQEGMRGMRGPRGQAGEPGMARAGRMGGPERVLALRERLSLSPDQVERLEALRLDHLEERQERMATLARIRSDVAAGEITPAEARARMQDVRAETEAGSTADAVLAILTDEQRALLQDTVQDVRGNRRMLRGEGPRGIQGRARPGVPRR